MGTRDRMKAIGGAPSIEEFTIGIEGGGRGVDEDQPVQVLSGEGVHHLPILTRDGILQEDVVVGSDDGMENLEILFRFMIRLVEVRGAQDDIGLVNGAILLAFEGRDAEVEFEGLGVQGAWIAQELGEGDLARRSLESDRSGGPRGSPLLEGRPPASLAGETTASGDDGAAESFGPNME